MTEKKDKNTLYLIRGIVIVILVVTAMIFIISYINLNQKTQKVEYYCKITEQELNNVGCTSNSNCWGAGTMCDSLNHKCVVVPTGDVCDINGENCKQTNLDLPLPNNQKDCEKISGNWELRLALN